MWKPYCFFFFFARDKSNQTGEREREREREHTSRILNGDEHLNQRSANTGFGPRAGLEHVHARIHAARGPKKKRFPTPDVNRFFKIII